MFFANIEALKKRDFLVYSVKQSGANVIKILKAIKNEMITINGEVVTVDGYPVTMED
jgi:hypothetical protein